MKSKMMAGIVVPGQKNSAKVVEIPTVHPEKDQVLIRILEVGIDGTDIDINRGEYGSPPNGQDFIIAGHEALGRIESSTNRNFPNRQLVTLVVRRPDSCINCRNGEMDMCVEGNYRECGIKGADGYMREYVTESPDFLVKVPSKLKRVAVLAEPASVVTKGIDEALEAHCRVVNPIERALIIGAGTLGLLTAAILRVYGLETHVMDIVPSTNLKAQLVLSLGANYIDGRESPLSSLPQKLGNLDLIFEATANSSNAFQAMSALGTNGVLCLLSLSTGGKELLTDASALNIKLVLGNKVVLGSVNSNKTHFAKALNFLGQIETKWPGWLNKLITRRLPLRKFKTALEPSPNHIKTIVEVHI